MPSDWDPLAVVLAAGSLATVLGGGLVAHDRASRVGQVTLILGLTLLVAGIVWFVDFLVAARGG